MSLQRILFLGSGPAFPDSIGFALKYQHLSKMFSGVIITPVDKSRSNMRMKIGNFELYGYPYFHGNSVFRNLYSFFYSVYYSLKAHYFNKKIDVIVSPNPLMTGLTALFISKLIGAKTIIEVNGNFETAFKFGRMGTAKPRLIELVKDKISKHIISYILKRASMVKLVYKNQLKPLNIKAEEKIKKTSFPNFVPINEFIESDKNDAKYILLMGYPWYLKGVDLLIKAFNRLTDEFPEYRLKVVGWCPEGREYFEELAKGNSRIDLCDPVFYEGVIPLMTGCSLYVLASRTDSSPRVLREAMASRKPIIAADIDGVPDLIRDGYNGLLFRKEDVDDLAEKIRKILSDPVLADNLARNGYAYVQEKLSEKRYVDNYKSMMDLILS